MCYRVGRGGWRLFRSRAIVCFGMSEKIKLGKSLWWLNATQFLGALNDNVFKLLVTFFVIQELGSARAGLLTNIGQLLFALPFILLLPAFGVLSDRISKRDVVFWAKALEIVVMLAAVATFAFGQAWLSFGVLFMMSAQSALFGPAKYGIIPELAPREQLSRANGVIVGATYLAIIIGTFGGSWLRDVAGDHFTWAAWVCVAIAVVGTLTAAPIERVPAAGTDRRASLLFFRDAWRTIRAVRGDRYLVLAMFGSAYFSLIGAFLQANVIPYGIKTLGLTDAQSGMLFLSAALGIGAGSVLAGRMSGRNIEFGVLPLAAIGLGLTSAALSANFVTPNIARALLFLAGLFSGLYIVPLDAFVQWRAPRDRMGEVIAATNWLGWIGVLSSAVVGVVIYGVLHLQPRQGFAIMGALTVVLTVVTIKALPDFLVRFIAVSLTRCLYRIRAVGLDNLPVEGGALLVSNHVSFMDALQIMACQQRRIRFMMHRSIYENNPLRAVFRLMGVIPIAMEDPPKKIIESLRAARSAMDEGFMVCIFAEGALTRNGLMRGFRPGFERIVRGSNHPIIPIYIGGAWGSIFSHYYGKQHVRLPQRWPYPVAVRFGQPMPAASKAFEVRQAIVELSCEHFDEREGRPRSLAHALVAGARRNWGKHAMSDTLGRRMTYGRTLTSAFALAGLLRRRTKGEPNVGVLLPSSVGSAVANYALGLLHKVTVNLNFTASREAFVSAIAQAQLKTILTSRAFVEKMPEFANTPGLLLLDDLLPQMGMGRKLAAWIKARLLPTAWVVRTRGVTPDDTTTIIFSSGTTGEPKGVELTHHNILSNIESIRQIFRPRREDNLCAAMPFFHSFGYTCGLWFPLLAGMSVSYHMNPLDGAKIAEVVRTERCTAIFASPTFLLAYLRRAEREDFATLRYVVAGAEKLKPQLADAFEKRFGIRPVEGFGATELSPVAALSLPDVEIAGILQTGTKPFSVGCTVPGVAARIVDPETFAAKPPGESGLLLIRGPNVMKGYLDKPEQTRAAIRDGWYVTGDIAAMDEDGFITITDRLARFSKIGGEMIPHIAIEDEYQKGLGRADAVLAVTSVPDEKRGERLVVLYTEAAGDPLVLHSIMEKSTMPNLWKPGRDSYYFVSALPVTGSGKLDVKTLRQRAGEMAGMGPMEERRSP